MASVRAVVRLGHQARSAANVKLRQPLAEVIVATDDARRREHIARHVDLVGGELGVKAVRLATSAEQFAEIEVMPLLKVLGPKYGRDLDLIRGLLREGEFQLDDGHVRVGDWMLDAGEFELRTRARDGFSVLDGDGFAVALDTEITPELELEGEARDLIRQIQVMRQEAGLDVTDRIRLTHPSGPVWDEHGTWIAGETLATESVSGDAVAIERMPA
jgi:isoleucyl-tRNA synthetase